MLCQKKESRSGVFPLPSTKRSPNTSPHKTPNTTPHTSKTSPKTTLLFHSHLHPNCSTYPTVESSSINRPNKHSKHVNTGLKPLKLQFNIKNTKSKGSRKCQDQYSAWAFTRWSMILALSFRRWTLNSLNIARSHALSTLRDSLRLVTKGRSQTWRRSLSKVKADQVWILTL